MTAHNNFSSVKMIRLGFLLSLIFFMHGGSGCKQKETGTVSIVWSGSKATGIMIPHALLEAGGKENTGSSLQIYLQQSGVPMLGDYQPVREGILFKPLIALTPGKQYGVFFKKKLIGRLQIPLPAATDAPALVAVYPSADTLPENLLKIYLLFSSPMREGEALRHIHVLNEQADTLSGIFLDLQPELWNPERTTLTLWLDPGRIKRGLIPNQRLGTPLKSGMHYTLVVEKDWKDVRGLALQSVSSKRFFVRQRDDTSPQPAQWQMALPQANTSQPLRIAFQEPLDPFLVPETVQIADERGTGVEGSVTLLNKEQELAFYPAKPWQPGRYRLRVLTYLEDLAGNNLNKVFDRDITRQQKKDDAWEERAFKIR